MRALNIQPQCAMAIYAHPDDADVAAGGLLAQWAQDGCAVHLVVVCDGDKGSHVLSADAGAVREVRGAEVEFAARPPRCRDRHEARAARRRGRERRGTARGVGGPHPSVSARGRRRTGPDRDVLRRGLREPPRPPRDRLGAVGCGRPAAAMPLYFPDRGEPHQVTSLLLSGTHEPDVVADITATIDTKVKAVLAHSSQLAGDADAIRELVYGRAEQAGRPSAPSSAEAFRSVELAF